MKNKQGEYWLKMIEDYRSKQAAKLSEDCIECGHSTAFGSGRFVNRLPADNGERDGWLCPECRAETCETCGEEVIEYTGRHGFLQCDECADNLDFAESMTFSD